MRRATLVLQFVVLNTLFLAFIPAIVFAQVSYKVTPSMIKQHVERRGLESVFEELFSDQTAANQVLLAIDSGEDQWLDIAMMLFQVEHARTRNMLTMSVGEAIQWVPEKVLGNTKLLKDFPIEKICTLEGMYEWRLFSPFLIDTAINRRLDALAKLKFSKQVLRDRASECTVLLKNEGSK